MRGGYRTYPTVFDIAGKKRRIAEIAILQQEPEFWNDRERAAELAQESSRLEKDVTFPDHASNKLADLQELFALARTENDAQTLSDIERELTMLDEQLTEQERLLRFTGLHDANHAIITIQSGAGGTDAQDWAEMLERMYLRYAERKGWKTSIIDRMPAEEAGIKHTTFAVRGDYAYGLLKGEHGIHRLVRLSPFNANNLRQTSFARVEVLPEISQTNEVAIDQKDLEIDTYRASGAGGQHVNKTSSAVRIRHIPTGVVAASQSQRSQAQNKAAAMALLTSKLQMLLTKQNVKEVKDLRGEHKEAAFGNQIRSYVLHPYTLVKDHRTDTEVHDAQGVLDGNLDPFVVY